MHCDVRPANIIVAAGRAVLVDWGAVAAEGAHICCRGVAAFAGERVFSAAGVAARPRLDALATLYTSLAIVRGTGCAPPWGQCPGDGPGRFGPRRRWLAACAAGGCPRAAAVARAALALEAHEGGDDPDPIASARGCLGPI